jgi:hypothetical protein
VCILRSLTLFGSERIEAFDEEKVSGLWLHAMDAYWGITSNALAKIAWTSMMKHPVTV